MFITALENNTIDDNWDPIYCDDYDSNATAWIPLCGQIGDYIAHSDVGLANTIFVGAIDSNEIGGGAIRATGVFAPHAIYVESPDGSTSQATPVLAAYAVNLAFVNPAWSSARLKQELINLARDETVEYFAGLDDDRRLVTETRTIKVIRPAFAPKGN